MYSYRLTRFGLLLWLSIASQNLQAGVWEELSQGRECGDYRPLTETEVRRAESLFRDILSSEQVGEEWLRQTWAELGYGPVQVPAAGDGWIGLAERATDCRGQGLFLINRQPRGNLAIQAPHAWYDRHSGEIAGSLLRDQVAILAWNSARRNQRAPGGTKADLAKRRDNLFSALSRALAETRPKGRLVQLHGFSNRKRSTRAGGSAAAIVSSGAPWSTPAVERIAACIAPQFEGPVLVYPSQVAELGGTENVQGQILRTLGHEGFVHLELNRPARERLRTTPELRSQLADCLSGGME